MSNLEVGRWILAAVLFLPAAIVIFLNYDNAFRLLPATRARVVPPGSRVSSIPLMGGVLGAAALAVCPAPALSGWWWMAFLIDFPGTFGVGHAGAETRNDAELAAEKEAEARAKEAARLAHEAYEARIPVMERALAGCLLGTAVGDALGLACEGLSPARREKLFPDAARYHLLPFGRGLCSDDTEHTVMLAQSLCNPDEHMEDEPQARILAASFAWRLRFWLLGLPAGIGMATLRAILKLWLFIPPRWSGVHSAGNGPAMRSAILGVVYGDRPARLRAMVHALTRITHTDPKAEQAAWTVAHAAHCAMQDGGRIAPELLLAACREEMDVRAAEWLGLVERVVASVRAGESTQSFAVALGLAKGVTGYSFHTVPVALHACLSHSADFRGAVLAVIECGGDTDTVAAIVGGIMGAGVGREGIPPAWLDKLVEWPRTVAWMQKLASQLARRAAGTNYYFTEPAPAAGAVKLLLRNVFFLAVVLGHGLRRLFPPY
jgi:ADP-ribosyl-[dinitrogen reductase] hydrolase